MLLFFKVHAEFGFLVLCVCHLFFVNVNSYYLQQQQQYQPLNLSEIYDLPNYNASTFNFEKSQPHQQFSTKKIGNTVYKVKTSFSTFPSKNSTTTTTTPTPAKIPLIIVRRLATRIPSTTTTTNESKLFLILLITTAVLSFLNFYCYCYNFYRHHYQTWFP